MQSGFDGLHYHESLSFIFYEQGQQSDSVVEGMIDYLEGEIGVAV